jgi:hypothetical protein
MIGPISAGMQAVLAGQQGAGWYIPVGFSATYAFHAIERIYTHRNGSFLQAWTGVLDLAMHPDVAGILSGGIEMSSPVVRLGISRRCIRSFVGHLSYV